MLLYSRQEASSDPSEQSASPSQMAARAIHSPLAQVASEKPHAVGGRVEGTMPAKSHYNIICHSSNDCQFQDRGQEGQAGQGWQEQPMWT